MSIKRIVFWDHLRGTWQYDLFCLLIIAFIFLTPKSWFEKRESLATRTAVHIVKAEDFSSFQSDFDQRFKNNH